MTVRPRVLVCGWSGAGNIGDELLTEVVIARLQAHGLEPVVRSADPSATTGAHGDIATAGRGLASLRAALAADAVVVGPGGIVQDHTSVWSLPAHLVPALIARIRRRPVIGLGLGADPLRRRVSRTMLRLALREAPVVVRDQRSADAMAAAGVSAAIDLDLAWELPTPPPVVRTGVTIALGPVAGSGALRPGRRRLVPDDPTPVVEAIQHLHDRVGGPLRLVGFRGERDERDAEVMAERLSGAEVVGAAAAVDAVRHAELIVTSRYHAAVVALAAGVPVLADVRQGKLAALATTPDLGSAVVGFTAWSEVGDELPSLETPVQRIGSGRTDDALAQLARRCRPGGS